MRGYLCEDSDENGQAILSRIRVASYDNESLHYIESFLGQQAITLTNINSVGIKAYTAGCCPSHPN